MYRTYELTEEEKNMPFTSMWAGDCMVYTIYETEEEKAEELARLARIDKEAEEAKKAYYNTLKEENTMTREEKLFSMTMKVLAGEAEKLGVKINKKGKKEDAVKRILDAEAAIAEKAIAQAEEVTEETTAEPVEEVTEDPTAEHIVEVEVTEVTPKPAEEPKKERKARQKKENPARVEFTAKAIAAVEAAGYAVKIWEKVPNLFAVKDGKKSAAEVRTGLKGWTLNVKTEVAERMGRPYTVQNYFVPAVLKFSYEDWDAFEEFIANI